MALQNFGKNYITIKWPYSPQTKYLFINNSIESH